MWGMGGWTGSDDEESLAALGRSIVLGCTFFDTAWVYGEGRSERLLGRSAAPLSTRADPHRHQDSAEEHAVARARRRSGAGDAYPADHIREFTERSLRNLDAETIDLQQFHVWSDTWADDEEWQRGVRALKDEKLIQAFGISVNRWQPTNVMRALKTGLVDSVQVVYNIFDQAPEDELFPYCEANGIAVIARVPFDEGSLTGTLRPDSTWPEGDWRNTYFSPEKRPEILARVERLEPLIPEGMDLPELALRFILENPAVATTIPGMRRPAHVERNLAASDGVRLPPRLRDALRAHRWNRP